MTKTAIDPFVSLNMVPLTAARRAAPVVPSDTADLARVTSAIYVGVSGDLTVIFPQDLDGATVTFKAVPVGRLDIQVRRILDTGTTATSIVALWG